jgi:hypothetical protein
MVWSIKCECSNRLDTSIISLKQFKEIKIFFERQVEIGNYIMQKPQMPYFVSSEKKWFANVWYKCKICGCLWEINYPDFPATGFVRKFPNGQYYRKQ